MDDELVVEDETRERDRLIWPDVVASTTMGDDRRYMVTAKTNNNESTAEILIYWHIPPDGGRPVLMIEVDEDTDDDSDIPLRIRRNEGLIFDATRDETTYLKEH